MRHIAIAPHWINRIDETLLPWMQDQLKPVDEDGKPLEIEDATYINIYLGVADSEKTVHLHLPPCVYADFDKMELIEIQFCATSNSDELPKGIQTSLKLFLKQHDKECETLEKIQDAIYAEGLSFKFTKGGNLVGDLESERIPLLDDNNKVEEWSLGYSHGNIIIDPDLNIIYVDDAGDQLLPGIKANNIDNLIQILKTVNEIIDVKIGETEAIKMLATIY